MDKPSIRLFYLVIDQLAGHWVEDVEVSPGIPPVNVEDYHNLGYVPNFSRLIRSGIWVRRGWNRGICDTAHGMKYLATGRREGEFWSPVGCRDTGFFEWICRELKGKVKIAAFTTHPWACRGYFYNPQAMYSLPGYYPDELMWRVMAQPWLRKRSDWNLVHIYFPTNDQVSLCPSYMNGNPHPLSSKHAYMLFLDGLLGEIIEFLEAGGFWDETVFVLASDHGYHLGCTTAHQVGARSLNWCCDHPPPYDCHVYDFEKDKPLDRYSGCARRITFILSGGGLKSAYRGRIVEEAEIIDVIPTIMDLMGIEGYSCDGTSILKKI
ncbi:MAG: hypothetical protein AYL33_002160 [Candidatus Bathyarchaeota archaeon B63]|nr:MAG: hypothetical protein AYL33_002160 [Candidatus Bathyarchaeota archaeon B63]